MYRLTERWHTLIWGVTPKFQFGSICGIAQLEKGHIFRCFRDLLVKNTS